MKSFIVSVLVVVALAILCAAVGVAFADDALPDPALTPGVTRPELVRSKICSIKWGRDARHVTEAMKRRVFTAYGMSGNDDPRCRPEGCEIDHLISRELGGADDAKNLWPQPYGGNWNARLKDKLENRLHHELCAGRITLDEARSFLVHDWRLAYRRYYGEPK